MTIFFQHVGEKGGSRDFPRTIGDFLNGLKLFRYDDVERLLTDLSKAEQDELRRTSESLAPNGFQIWGIPSGAKAVLKSLRAGDWLLLLESDRPGGQFYYGGRVIFRPQRELFSLSRALWGEARFPLVVFLKGYLTSYSWETFRNILGYKENWRLSGNTYRVTRERLTLGSLMTEDDLLELMLPRDIENHEEGLALDAADAERSAAEGKTILREHIIRERDPFLISKFKATLESYACTICGFDFEEKYGDIGEKFIEAHHIRPIGER